MYVFKKYFFQVLEDRSIFLQRIVMVKIAHFALQGILFSRVRVYRTCSRIYLFHVDLELVVLHKTRPENMATDHTAAIHHNVCY